MPASFNENVKRVLFFADQEAKRSTGIIQANHLLLALLRESSPLAELKSEDPYPPIFKSPGVLHDELEKIKLTELVDSKEYGRYRLSVETSRILDHATAKANEEGDDVDVNMMHLVYGFTKDNGEGAKFLAEHGVTYVQQKVTRVKKVSPPPAPTAPTTPVTKFYRGLGEDELGCD